MYLELTSTLNSVRKNNHRKHIDVSSKHEMHFIHCHCISQLTWAFRSFSVSTSGFSKNLTTRSAFFSCVIVSVVEARLRNQESVYPKGSPKSQYKHSVTVLALLGVRIYKPFNLISQIVLSWIYLDSVATYLGVSWCPWKLLPGLIGLHNCNLHNLHWLLKSF